MQKIILNNSYSAETQGKNHSRLIVVGLQSKLADVSKIFQSSLETCTQVIFFLGVILIKIKIFLIIENEIKA